MVICVVLCGCLCMCARTCVCSHTCLCVLMRDNTVLGKILTKEKLVYLVNRKLFAKILLANIPRYTENAFCICTDCSLFTKFFLANNFYLNHPPKFLPPAKYFPCTVLNIIVKDSTQLDNTVSVEHSSKMMTSDRQ